VAILASSRCLDNANRNIFSCTLNGNESVEYYMNTKTCSSCKKDFNLSEFTLNKTAPDGYNAYCVECRKKYRKTHKDKTVLNRGKRSKSKKQKFIQSSKSTPCVDCGKSYPHYVMDFDHVPERGEKKFNLSQHSRRGISWQNIGEEIIKCDVVCSNCHRERTHKRSL